MIGEWYSSSSRYRGLKLNKKLGTIRDGVGIFGLSIKLNQMFSSVTVNVGAYNAWHGFTRQGWD